MDDRDAVVVDEDRFDDRLGAELFDDRVGQRHARDRGGAVRGDVDDESGLAGHRPGLVGSAGLVVFVAERQEGVGGALVAAGPGRALVGFIWSTRSSMSSWNCAPITSGSSPSEVEHALGVAGRPTTCAGSGPRSGLWLRQAWAW